MKILFTGASSFTGFWFVKTLAAAGHEMICPITRGLDNYDGIRRRRLDLLGPVCHLVPAAAFGSDNFLRLVQAEKFDQLCHHGADVTNYRSPDFDAQAALRKNTDNLSVVLDILQNRGLGSVVVTGTYFEAGEGAGDGPTGNVSPYSLSKTLTFDSFQARCSAGGLPLGKFVIPNPFGPFEEPRFTAYLMRTWKEGKPAGVKTPDYLRDNIHVDLLSEAYVNFVGRVPAVKSGMVKINPSGYCEKQGEFAQRVAREVRLRLGWKCDLELARQEDFSEPLQRVNTQPVAPLFPAWNEYRAWDEFAHFYSGV